MFALTDTEQAALTALGARLRRRRLLAEEPQFRTAARIGLSVPTYRKLEQGDPSAQIGAWLRAIRLYSALEDVATLIPESLFDADLSRQRAPRAQ